MKSLGIHEISIPVCRTDSKELEGALFPLYNRDIRIGIDRAEREGCLLPERQEDGSRRKQKIIFYMKGWLQNVKTKYL